MNETLKTFISAVAITIIVLTLIISIEKNLALTKEKIDACIQKGGYELSCACSYRNCSEGFATIIKSNN